MYALHQGSGGPPWRYRSAPNNRRLVEKGRVEFVWPVHASVLLQDETVCFAAGHLPLMPAQLLPVAQDDKNARAARDQVYSQSLG